MTIAPFGWHDLPSTTTPITSANLEAMHAAAGAYTDAALKNAPATGDNLNIFPSQGPTTGQLLQMLVGSSTTGDASLTPVAKVNRTINIAATAITGDGSEQTGAIQGITSGTSSANQVQAVGVFGGAQNAGNNNLVVAGVSPDAAGLYGAGRILGGGVGVAMGVFAYARSDSATGRTSAIQATTYNNSGANQSVNTTGFSQQVGQWMWAEGPNQSGAGIELGNPLGQQFDVGLHFNAQVIGGLTGPTFTADIQSDSTAKYGLLLNGTYGNAAMSVKAGAGPIILGGTTSGFASVAKLDIISSGAADPQLVVRSTGAASTSLLIQNSTSGSRYFVAGSSNNFLTGTVGGDTGIQISASAGTFHVGQSGGASNFRVNNTGVGFFKAPVAQQTSAGNTHTITAGSTTNVFTNTTFDGGTGSTAYTIGDLVLAMKNYGLIAT